MNLYKSKSQGYFIFALLMIVFVIIPVFILFPHTDELIKQVVGVEGVIAVIVVYAATYFLNNTSLIVSFAYLGLVIPLTFIVFSKTSFWGAILLLAFTVAVAGFGYYSLRKYKIREEQKLENLKRS